MKKMLLTIACSGLIGSLTYAQGDRSGESGGSDSCGLGWQITADKTMSATTTRGSTNSVVPPTFGMTSGTIGCVQHPIAAKDLPTARYVATNFDLLKHEMAMGQGETLVGLFRVMGCSDGDKFARATKRHYARIFPHSQVSALEMFENVQHVVAGECKAL